MTSLPNLPVVEISKPVDTFRLISEKSPILSPFIRDEDSLLILRQIKELTSNWSSVYELVYGINARIINATFTSHSRPKEGNRFNDDTRGDWYCAFECQTAIEEVAYHHTRELYRIDEYKNEIIYQELLAGFTGAFHDARGLPRDKGILGTEPETSYPLGQKLANELIAEGGRGIIYPSVRIPKGTCLVAFHPQMIQGLQFGKRWKMSWNGSREYTVEEI